MSDELSGRDLEIATAKALGWTVRFDPEMRRIEADGWVSGGFRLVRPDGTKRAFSFGSTKTAQDAWERGAPEPLTDPAAFATVLAALSMAGRYEIVGGADMGSCRCAIYQPHGPLSTANDGDTLQEAACRAFVAWKEAS